MEAGYLSLLRQIGARHMERIAQFIEWFLSSESNMIHAFGYFQFGKLT